MQIHKSHLIKPRFQVVMKQQRESQPHRNVLAKQSQWNPSLHEQTERISFLLFSLSDQTESSVFYWRKPLSLLQNRSASYTARNSPINVLKIKNKNPP